MKRVLLLCLTVMCAVGIAAPVLGAASRSVNGMAVADPAADNNGTTSTTVAPLGVGMSGTGYTGIDDLSPCYFINTFPISKAWYKQYGVQFKGPNSTDGAAVLDECSGWGITGFSSPNILAFNCNLTMANGGSPVGPETILLSPPVDAFQLSIASGADVGSTVEIAAKTADGGTVDSQIVTLTSTMQTVFLIGSKKIKKIVIGVPANTNACIYAVDNMYWGTP